MPVRILLYEDNEVMRDSLSALLLQSDDHVLCGAFDNCSGIEKQVAHLQPDVILMDIEMPECDGLEAARRIRAFEAQSGIERIPILALTASALGDDRSQCLAAGMDAYLTKPFDRQDLEEAIQKLLHRANAA